MRLHLIGASCSGKSTLGRAIATRLGLPFIDLDELYWEPGWVQVGHAELARRLAPHLQQDGWVVVGNYTETTERDVWPRLTHLLSLDLPYPPLLWRGITRTLRRGLTGEPCCNGNREQLWRALHPEGVLVYTALNWRRKRRRYGSVPSEPKLAHVQVRRVEHTPDVDEALALLTTPPR